MAGKRQLGSLHPYAGFASYLKATRLAQPAGAVLIEYHLAFAEPREWFNGAESVAIQAADRRAGSSAQIPPFAGLEKTVKLPFAIPQELR